jgi:hypothetical protein
MDTNDKNGKVEVIKLVRAVGKALRYTGILLILLSFAATVAGALDTQAGDVLATIALGLITAQGLIMIRNARGILRMADNATLNALRNPGRDR